MRLTKVADESKCCCSCFAWLCPDCHILGAHAVHRDYAVCRKLQQAAQRRYEIDHTREEFIELMGRSYL